MRKIVIIFKFFIPTLILVLAIWLGIKRTDCFSINLITRFSNDENMFIANISKEDIEAAKNILSQKFHYLTRGRESFIFESEDNNYILKFFDSTCYDTKIFCNNLTLPKFLDKYRKKHYNRRLNKLAYNLSSAHLAFNKLKDDSALIFVNLNKTNFFDKKIRISNKYGKTLVIDLNDVFFILQKKCDLFYVKYAESKDDDYKKYLIDSFLEMVHRRNLNLIIDDDIGKKRRNWGIYNNKVVTFDIGRWYFDEKLKTTDGYKKEMLKATKTLRKYLLQKEPQNLDYLSNKLDEYIRSFNQSVAFLKN